MRSVMRLALAWTLLWSTVFVVNELTAGEFAITTVSWHYVEHPYADYGDDWQNVNPGVIYAGDYGAVGVLRNSFDNTSFMIAGNVGEARRGYWRIRGDVGIATGYSDIDYSRAGIAPIAFATGSYKAVNVHLGLGVVTLSLRPITW